MLLIVPTILRRSRNLSTQLVMESTAATATPNQANAALSRCGRDFWPLLSENMVKFPLRLTQLSYVGSHTECSKRIILMTSTILTAFYSRLPPPDSPPPVSHRRTISEVTAR